MDVLLGILLAAILMKGLVPWLIDRNTQQRVGIAATQAIAFRQGVLSYQQANQAAIIAATGPTTPYTRTVAQLIAANALPPNFSATTPYGGTLVASWVQPTAGVLQPIVIATGGATINDGDLADIGNTISAQGGEGAYVPSYANTQIVCSMGSCNPLSLSAYGYGAMGGHYAIAMFKGTQTSSDDFLHRHNDGVTAHGQMNQPIDMNGNPVNNATDVRMQGANQGMTMYGGGEKVYGSADYGVVIQTNYATRVKTFNDGHTEFYNYMSVPAGGNGLLIGGSAFYGDGSNIALRPAANGGSVYIQGTTSGGGSANLQVAGNVYAQTGVYSGNLYTGSNSAGAPVANSNVYTGGSGGWYNTSFGGGINMQDSSYVRVTNDKNFYTGGQGQFGSLQSNSTINSAGRITSGEMMQIVGYANAGWGCDASAGALFARATDGTNQPLMCKAGIWTTLGETQLNYAYVGAGTNWNYTGSNGTTHTIWVVATASSVSCGTNDYGMLYYVNGNLIAQNTDYNGQFAKVKTVTFPVPVGGSYQAVVHGYVCPTQSTIFEYR